MKRNLYLLIVACIFASNLQAHENPYLFSKNSKTIPLSFNSQASQDQFVYQILYELLGKNDPGYYLEIGAAYPKQINNSYFFERHLGWIGVSLDISDTFMNAWKDKRKNPLLIVDATKADYTSILKSFPKVIDYLSLDVDGVYDAVLMQLPLNETFFKVITIEHDAYRFGNVYQKKERKILKSYGYHLLCENVSNVGNPFEDWWIYPKAFPKQVFDVLITLDLNNKNHSQIIETLQMAIPEILNSL